MHYYTAKTFKQSGFDIIVDWTYEDTPLDYCFDPAVEDIAEMAERCNNAIDTHYIARVRAMFAGLEMGTSYLGSCYAYDCEPEDDIENGINGYLDDMVAEAIEEAKTLVDTIKAA